MKIFNSDTTQTELSLSHKSRKGQGRPAYKVSAKGIDLICKFEGFSSHVYKDVAGYPTIGYGHKLLPFENYTTISQAEARSILIRDIAFAEKAVNEAVTVPLNQDQFDAIVSFVYNIGEAAFRKSTFLKLVNSGDIKGAAVEMLKWSHAGGEYYQGLLNRRQSEAVLLYAHT